MMEKMITVTLQVEREGDQYVLLCPELDIASYGDTVEEALFLLGEGFRLRNARGADQVYKKVTAAGSRTVTVATHGEQIPRRTIRSLCRQAGWTVEELIALVEKYK